MKIRVFLPIALLVSLSALAAQAQTKLPPRKPVAPRGRVAPTGITLKDGAMMKEGKVMMTQNGHTDPLSQDVTLVNGTKIAVNGTVTAPDGTTTMLKEGDYVSLTGRVTSASMKAQQDSLMMAAKDGGKDKTKMKRKNK
ncbi:MULTISPECIES: DUF6799 domain-containing protein [Hymenobacter]|uniref:DUF6799 domain-containing protein n=1 Tax=Hymenobacter jejuensis TaxID=2502781 RepID=A0A5B8A1X8_9BACT|nr:MULTISPECIES: DUF6799 domain-containing protein [Hymenobacter]MBC6991878.1 hypothetical protein [Hymenobacter sp. BT491]QDA60192.1 hypothetical protein FHG12_08755 [Hymenobacter jejuensis]